MRALIAVALLLTASVCSAGFWDRVKSAAETAYGNSTSESPSDGELVKGLKEALKVGAERAVAKVSKKGGFLNDPKIRIPLPSKLRKAASVLERAGYGDKIRAFEVSMNMAAEKAAKKALPVFWDALRDISFEDAVNILNGGDHAATDYFRRKTWDRLYSEFKPIVARCMDEVEVTRKYQALMKNPYVGLAASGFGFESLEDYVTKEALNGLFKVLALEEERIRRDPAARTTGLLRKVFGGDTK